MQRPLFLSGFMATGKTSVGRLVAERTGRPFVDLDQRIESQLGKTVAQIFADHGETHFRSLERAALDALLSESETGQAPVVALGGGALMPRDLRLRALDRAVVVTLEASPGEVLRRTGGKSGRPLLDQPNGDTRVRELLEQRSAAYAVWRGTPGMRVPGATGTVGCVQGVPVQARKPSRKRASSQVSANCARTPSASARSADHSAPSRRARPALR